MSKNFMRNVKFPRFTKKQCVSMYPNKFEMIKKRVEMSGIGITFLGVQYSV